MIRNVELFCCSQYQVNSLDSCNLVRFKLRITSGDHNHCFRSFALDTPYKLTAFLICIISYRTGVYHIDISNFFKILFYKAILLKQPRNRRGLRVI